MEVGTEVSLYELKEISPIKTAKFLAVFHFLISLVFFIPFFAVFSTISFIHPPTLQNGQPMPKFPFVFLLLMPLFYAIGGFMLGLIGSIAYNELAKRLGGIELKIGKK
jgi:heme A synthase